MIDMSNLAEGGSSLHLHYLKCEFFDFGAGEWNADTMALGKDEWQRMARTQTPTVGPDLLLFSPEEYQRTIQFLERAENGDTQLNFLPEEVADRLGIDVRLWVLPLDTAGSEVFAMEFKNESDLIAFKLGWVLA